MSETPKDKDQEKGDEVLRRLLKTPPDHRTAKKEKGDGRSRRPPVSDQGVNNGRNAQKA
ncbi:hypothetical protein JQK88_10400 [Mesorhizobium caraganae]|uniref:hypothetical protein n=1 Tax=Mesorhizobium caraganae TaxID=483206 RepID=UPI00193AADA9|nr:hypothetical protein [Mesorhizobium caraganae]MBM2711657.1 hypothetical protein [Mesorhizobium caraganae]